MVLRTITGARTPVCLLTAIISVEAVTPPRWLSAAFSRQDANAGRAAQSQPLNANKAGLSND
jgi:hypothetical protein